MSVLTGRCRCCDADRLRTVPFGYSFRGRWLQAIECAVCGIIYLDPQPSAEEIASLYTKEYFEGDFRCGHAGSCITSPLHDVLVDKGLLDRLKALKPGGRLLEVGCAAGTFLHAAKEAGFDVSGVEYSADAAQLARDRFGLRVFTGDVTGARFPSEAFDLVFLGDVVEHLPDPRATLREIRRILAPGGALVLACPSQTNTLFSRLGFLLYGMLGRRATVHLPPYHLFEFRPACMEALLARCGYERISIVQAAIPPSMINVRGTFPERAGKRLLQYPNALLTSVLGILGDRMEVTAFRHHD
ncbi:MAG: class I SAM-dependent methyltransferase [Bacteroidota bacterium]